MHFNSAKHPILYSMPEINDLPVHPTKKSRTRAYANPNTDILESKDAYKAIFQLPGVSKENISINFENNALTLVTKNQIEKLAKVDGEVSEELEGKLESSNSTEASPKPDEFKARVKQITCKPYRKAIEFPTKINSNNISANYSNGLLTLTLPKLAKQKRTISIL
jgi:HSP20 family protein